MTAILFGSISTLADTSELQREAFNRAFREHGLDWSWSQDDYRELLTGNGGRRRVEDEAKAKGQDVDAAAVHETKSRIFQELVRGGVQPRPGVAETIKGARQDGVKVALVTTTSADNVDALLGSLGGDVGRDDFDLVVDVSTVDQPKPEPAAYEHALRSLGERPGSSVAIEDNVGGVSSARAAGVAVVAFPNENTAGHDFGDAADTVDRVDLDSLRALAGQAA